MCLDALEFFDENDYTFSQYLTSDELFSENLEKYMSVHVLSEGISDDFSYYPFIFIGDRAFSGFDDAVMVDIKEIME
jgi:hypothetical protein